MEDGRIKVGDMVRCGVYVNGEWKPMHYGRVVSQSSDGAISHVDIMSHHGGRAWVIPERTSHLRNLETPNRLRCAAEGPHE